MGRRSTERTGNLVASAGTYVSGVGHAGLLVWLIAGWGFQADPLPFEVSEVSVVSGEEFAALLAAATPDPGEAAPDTLVAPVVGDVPDAPAPEDEVAAAVVPEPAPVPTEDAPPPDAPTRPDPVEDVTDIAPVALPPQEPVEANPEPIVSETPAPRPAPRVAPEPVQAPEPDVLIADVEEPAVVPDDAAEEPAPIEPVQEAVPEEAATEIATEADVPSGAVEVSVRPAVRPNRPTPAPDPEPEVEPQTADVVDQAIVGEAVAAAIASVGGVTESPAVQQGPPLTGSEKDTFRIAVNGCWNVDPGSEAARATVVVAFNLTEAGRVDGAVRLVSATGGSDGAQSIAFQAARRAILRCQSGGYTLPAEKYDQWREVEITFDPSGMRLR